MAKHKDTCSNQERYIRKQKKDRRMINFWRVAGVIFLLGIWELAG